MKLNVLIINQVRADQNSLILLEGCVEKKKYRGKTFLQKHVF